MHSAAVRMRSQVLLRRTVSLVSGRAASLAATPLSARTAAPAAVCPAAARPIHHRAHTFADATESTSGESAAAAATAAPGVESVTVESVDAEIVGGATEQVAEVDEDADEDGVEEVAEPTTLEEFEEQEEEDVSVIVDELIDDHLAAKAAAAESGDAAAAAEKKPVDFNEEEELSVEFPLDPETVDLEPEEETTQFTKFERRFIRRMFTVSEPAATSNDEMLMDYEEEKFEAAEDETPMYLSKKLGKKIALEEAELDRLEDEIVWEEAAAAAQAAEEGGEVAAEVEDAEDAEDAEAVAEAAKIEAATEKALTSFLKSLKLGDQVEKLLKLATDPDGAQARYAARYHKAAMERGLELQRVSVSSIDHLTRLSTRDLKEIGLSVRQRKQFLKLIDRYKVQMRANSALALIRQRGIMMKPAKLQEEVYKIMYGHIYAFNATRASNKVIESEWRRPITAHRESRKMDHNNFRGLREPEIMEMAKIEAGQVNAAWHGIQKQIAAEEIRKQQFIERQEKKREALENTLKELDEQDSEDKERDTRE